MHRFIKKFFGHVLYILTSLLPRDKRKWIFASGNGVFTGNPKFFFLYIANKHRDRIEPIWLSKNIDIIQTLRENGYKSYHISSLKGMWSAIRAGYSFKDGASSGGFDIFLSGGSKTINLYHGSVIKKIALDCRTARSRNKIYQIIGKLIRRILSKSDYVIVTSVVFQKIFCSAYDINKNKVPIMGYTRNDVFFKEILGEDIGLPNFLISALKNKTQRRGKIILYAPTWRASRATGGDSIKEGKIDLKEIDLLMEKTDSLFLLKLHAGTQLKNLTVNYKNIILIPSEVDITFIVKHTDILITDYSSIYFDFLLLDRPVILFPFDIDKYIAEDRELYFDYDKIVAGPKAYNFNDLLMEMEKTLDNYDSYDKKYKQQRGKVKNMAFKYDDGNSSERIFNFLTDRKK